MNPHLLRLPAITALCLAASCSRPSPERAGAGDASLASSAQEPELAGTNAKPGQRDATHGFAPFDWHDGARERRAWMQPGRLVDHAPDDASRARVLSLDPGAEADEPVQGAPRLWRLSASASDPLALCAAANAGAGRFSPLFRDNPSESSPARSLPGGVVVTFAPDWSDERARAWLAGRGLAVRTALALGAPTYVIESLAGLATLELANELRTAPELGAAYPDWWVAAAPY